MGYMALLRNLRNFDDAGVPDDVAATGSRAAPDPERGRGRGSSRSGSFGVPGRAVAAVVVPAGAGAGTFPDAARRCRAARWSSSTPRGPCTTASPRGRPRPGRHRGVFGLALAPRSENPRWSSASYSQPSQFRNAESVLNGIEGFTSRAAPTPPGRYGGTTGHATPRVIITDEQAWAGYTPSTPRASSRRRPRLHLEPRRVRVRPRAFGRRNRHGFGGLTDVAFRMINLLESGHDADWSDLFGTASAVIRRSSIAARFYVDRCHRTGAVRGLLCGNCNTGLGLFADNPGPGLRQPPCT